MDELSLASLSLNEDQLEEIEAIFKEVCLFGSKFSWWFEAIEIFCAPFNSFVFHSLVVM